MHLNENSRNVRRERLALVLHSVGDPNRMRLLCEMFAHPGMCVSELSERMETSVAIVSHHLRTLSNVGVVVPRKKGKKVCYEPSDSPIVSDIKKIICKYSK